MNVEFLLFLLVALPAVAFLLLAGAWLVGLSVPEKAIARFTALIYLSASVLAAALAVIPGTIQTPGVEWFAVGEYRYTLALSLDRLSAPFVLLTAILTGLTGAFSARYLHREPGFLRFFAMLHLFAFGALLLFTAGSFDLVVGGWELVGITSVLLIAYFTERKEPVQNALRVFGIYRAADIGLLVAAFLLHHLVGTASFSSLFAGQWPGQGSVLTGIEATAVALLLLLAAAGKSAQGPFSGWLPRAMEGPTPSSAIFYGAISVHAGVYLLLRAYPILSQSPVALAAVALTGLVTAFFGTLVGRACTDAKTSLAYASLSQVGLIFVELGLGFPTVALWHAMGHATVRTLQFLRAPSALHEYHQIYAAAGGHLEKTGLHFEAVLPAGARLWLYRLAADRGHLDSLLDRIVVGPLRTLGILLTHTERRLTQPDPQGERSQVLRKPVPGDIDA